MFPEKTKWFWRPIGWKDLGKKKRVSYVENGKNFTKTKLCSISNDRVHIGRENNKLFFFCPRCMIKMKNE